MSDTSQLFEMIMSLTDRVLTLELQLSVVQVQVDDLRREHPSRDAAPPPIAEMPEDYQDDGLD
jgi:hypothetical protein